MQSSNKQSQIFSIDLVIAMIGFVLLVISASLAWDYAVGSIGASEERRQMELTASNVLSSLLETRGNPPNWSSLDISEFNGNSVHSLGLAKNDTLGLSNEGLWQIDLKKLTYLNSTSYNASKMILGLEGYEFNLTVSKYNGSSFAFNHAVSSGLRSDNVVRITRFALLDGKWAELVLMVGK